MSFLYHPEEEIVICSPMEGRITFNGAPAAGAKLERFVKWKDEDGQTDTTFTDGNGYFRFPIIKEKAKLPKLSQFVIGQEIHVYFNGDKYPVWAKAKREKGLYGELDGSPVNFRCDLTDELAPVDAGKGMLLTSCKWDSIEKNGD